MSLKASILHNFLKEEFANASISLIGQGWSSVVFQVNDYIVRFPKQNMEDYEKEQNICDHISNKISVAVPSVIIYKNKKHPYAIHKKIEGLKWNQHTVCQLSDKNEDRLAQSLAQFCLTVYEKENIPVFYLGGLAVELIRSEKTRNIFFDTLGKTADILSIRIIKQSDESALTGLKMIASELKKNGQITCIQPTDFYLYQKK
jgi:hypothetical protein